jgi:hypothetical protein
MGTGPTRKLEEIASNLDDLSLTLEEIKESVQEEGRSDQKVLDKVEKDMERAADAIDDVVDSDSPETE